MVHDGFGWAGSGTLHHAILASRISRDGVNGVLCRLVDFFPCGDISTCAGFWLHVSKVSGASESSYIKQAVRLLGSAGNGLGGKGRELYRWWDGPESERDERAGGFRMGGGALHIL